MTELAYCAVCGIQLVAMPVVRKIADRQATFCSDICADRFQQEPVRYAGEPVLRVRGLHKSFGSGEAETPVLRGIDLTVWEGEFVSIVGASGSGKSTLLNMIGMLDRPTRGDIYIEGKHSAEFSDEERAGIRAQTFGFVFQQYNLIPWLSVIENAMLPALFSGRGKARESALRQRLVDVGLKHRIGHLPSHLSGGEQQRAALVRAIANDPDIILGDEPTGNLDSETGAKVLEVLKHLHSIERKTLIIVTHDATIAGLADRTIVLKDGRVLEHQAREPGAYTH